MVNSERSKLPAGSQSFKEIREKGYKYVDKTSMIWNLTNRGGKYNYLSRPRRFGKSVLVDTLQAYLEGRRELFEGLKIMELEKEWSHFPVIRLDMSGAGATKNSLRSYLSNVFMQYEYEYDISYREQVSLAVRFDTIIKKAYEKSGAQVCILIDEYDSPLQHSWKTAEHEKCTDIYREVFAILKSADQYERFVFITGITKFTQISLFSVLNNLTNISFLPEYAEICGITDKEISDNFLPELEMMGQVNGWTLEETHEQLKNYYDGYHFSRRNMTDMYNPFSLINALNTQELSNFWASSGATSLLPKFVDDMEVRLSDYDDCLVLRNTLETSDVTGGGPELFLYQSGYLTIKSVEGMAYHLGFPNEEVRQALYDTVLLALTLRKTGATQSMQARLYVSMENGNIEDIEKIMKALVADVPYSNKKLESMDMEERYRLILSTILNAIGFRVEVEHMLSTGRIDILCTTANHIYVMELKLKNNGGIEAAARQIKERRYTEPFKTDKREVIALAIELDDMGKGLLNVEKVK